MTHLHQDSLCLSPACSFISHEFSTAPLIFQDDGDIFFNSETFSRELHIFVVHAEAVKAIKAVCAVTKDRYRCSQFRCDVTETVNTSVCPLPCRSVHMSYWTETILTYLNQRHPKVKLSFLCHLAHHVHVLSVCKPQYKGTGGQKERQ